MTEELRSQIQTAAFLAYIMYKEDLDKPAGLRRMAFLCATTQIALGLADLSASKGAASKGAS